MKEINSVVKEFFSDSYDFFRKKYLRQQALSKLQDYETIPRQIFEDTIALFTLSTGRCGTYYLTRLLNKIQGLEVHHEAHPKLAMASKYVFEHQVDQSGGNATFLAGRHCLIRDAYLFDKVYVETNNRLTFFAPYIEQLMPRARFIHLVRHPGAFVRSGMRRGYYSNDGNIIVSASKICPPENNPFHSEWASYSRLEKISWLWYQTNLFIEEFKEAHPEKVLTVKSEELFNDSNSTISRILNFMNMELQGHIAVEPHSRNEQKSGSFPRYENWSPENKNKMKAIVGELATKYNYQI